MPPLLLPDDYARIRVVNSFEELVTTRFGDGVNALCWRRELVGNFAEVVEQLAPALRDERTTLDETLLGQLPVSAAGRAAIDVLLADQKRLQDRGLAPLLDCLHGYPRDDESEPVPTHVYSFHADSATVEADTYLCSYTESPSEGLRNDQAVRRVDVPETRAELLRRFGGKDDGTFREFLQEHCYDLHYVPTPGAEPFSFGVGHLWRIAIQYPGSPVPPCIHRAPEDRPGRPPRLLLIS